MADSDLVQHLLPRHEISIIAGASGAGKTSITMQLISCIQHHRPFFGMSTTPNTRIGYIAADRGGDSINHWAKIMDVDLSQIKFKSLVKDEDIDLKKFETNPMGLLLNLIRSMMPLDLLIIDPLIVFFGTDTKSYTTNAKCLIQLNRVAHQHKVTILGIHHAVKARTDFGFKRPQDRISGTGAFLGYSSTQIFLDTPEESGESHHTLHIISHTAAPMAFSLVRGTDAVFYPAESEETQLSKLILSAVPIHGAIATADIVAALGSTPRRTVELYLNRLLREGVLTRPSHGKYAHPQSQAS